MEKGQWILIDKKQNGLKESKNDKSSTLPPYLIDIHYKVTYGAPKKIYSVLSPELEAMFTKYWV